MEIRDGFISAVGNTPLIRLASLSRETGCEILGKAEFLNPGGSVKDRAALWIIRAAEKSGALRAGGTVVEGTAGNTGIGLAHICAARGYKCVIVIPDNQSEEKMELLRILGAEVRPVPPKPYKDDDNYQKVAGRLAAATPNAIWANQFDNVINRQAHYESTGPEIWRDTHGKVDAFVSAVGTGGTLAGTARFLKEKNRNVRIVLADPHGSALYTWAKTGELKAEGHSITEGIGTTRITANFEDTPVDDAERISDIEAVGMVYRLLREEGLFVGGSTGINVAAAVRDRPETGSRAHDRDPAVRSRLALFQTSFQSGLAHGKRACRGYKIAAIEPRTSGRVREIQCTHARGVSGRPSLSGRSRSSARTSPCSAMRASAP
jgi:cysteine synthase A